MADNAARAMEFFQSKGLSPEDSAALVWNFQQESGRNLNPTLSHDGGTGFGIAGFRDPTPGHGRWTNLQNFAAGQGLDPGSLDTQLAFSWNELNGPERAVLQRMQAAQTPQDKAAAAIGYFRPRADYAAQRASRVGEVLTLLGGNTTLPTKSTSSKTPFEPPLSVSRKGTDDGTLGSALAMLAPSVSSAEEPLTPLVNQAQSGPFDEPIDVSAFQPRTTRRSSRRA